VAHAPLFHVLGRQNANTAGVRNESIFIKKKVCLEPVYALCSSHKYERRLLASYALDQEHKGSYMINQRRHETCSMP
jgi:hypothetical protein